MKRGTGRVFIVGAGPGAADLLTVKAARLLREADAIVYDRLVSGEVRDLARPEAERIFVGKERGAQTAPQSRINELLVGLARAGKQVVRLKGGDPFVFGRGAEEALALAREGIPFEIVPGITAANGAGAYAGIPLTHRDAAHACVIAAGSLKDGNTHLDWPMLARPGQTVVMYMGLAVIEEVCRKLIAHRLPPGTPAALIEQATTARQRVVVGTLATLPGLAVRARPKPPTLIIIGDVVKMRGVLAWFDAERCGLQVADEEPVALAGNG